VRSVVTVVRAPRSPPSDADQVELRPANHLPTPSPRPNRERRSRGCTGDRRRAQDRDAEPSPRHGLSCLHEEARRGPRRALPLAPRRERRRRRRDRARPPHRRHAKRRGLVKKPRKTPPPSRTHDVPAHVSREVWKRDDGRCQWRTADGGVCGSTHQVELDHVVPRARGGASTVDNLRCLCRWHNDRHAREVYGDEWMDQCTPKPTDHAVREPMVEYGIARAATRPLQADTRAGLVSGVRPGWPGKGTGARPRGQAPVNAGADTQN
jgi:5-methylcytosine-specific restriction endonuclease McrA